MAMMRFDDFNIIALIQCLRRCFQELEHHVHPDAHVGRENDGDVFCGTAEFLFLLRGKSGCADHHFHAAAAAQLNMLERALGPGEINEYIGPLERTRHIVAD